MVEFVNGKFDGGSKTKIREVFVTYCLWGTLRMDHGIGFIINVDWLFSIESFTNGRFENINYLTSCGPKNNVCVEIVVLKILSIFRTKRMDHNQFHYFKEIACEIEMDMLVCLFRVCAKNIETQNLFVFRMQFALRAVGRII